MSFWHDNHFDTETALAKTTAWVNKWQRRLHIPEYEVTVGIDKPNTDECSASCGVQVQYLAAHVMLNPNDSWDGMSEQEEEQIVLHELCHIVTARSRSLASDMFFESDPALWNRFAAADEEAVERICRQTWQAYEGRD